MERGRLRRDDVMGELTALVSLAWPMIVAQLLQVSLGFVDTVMVGRAGPKELAVVGIGSSLWILVYLGVLGMMMSISPIAAYYAGAGHRDRMTEVFRQGLWYAAGVGVVSFVAVREIAVVARWIAIDPEILPGLEAYLDAISWGIPAACLAMVPRFVAESAGHVKPMMVIFAALVPLNVFGNWVLVFGNLGFPVLGATGAAWASAAGLWLVAAGMFGWIFASGWFPGIRARASLARPDTARIGEMLRLGIPISISMMMETSLFSVVAVLMGTFGAVPLAAHQVAINYAALMFMVPVGLSMAITVRVGQALGAGRAVDARFRGQVGIGLAGAFMFCSGVFMVTAPGAIAAMYTSDAAVAAAAAGLLLLAAAFQLFDGLQVSAAGALRAYKDTRVPMMLCLVAYWPCGFVLSYLAAFHLGFGPRGLWMGLVAGLALAALLLTLRFGRISRRWRPLRSGQNSV